jgi:hypothetical protein
VLRIMSGGVVHEGDWVAGGNDYGVSRCGFSFGADLHNEAPWPDALWRNLGAYWQPGWVRRIDESTDVDCMACVAAERP